MLVVAHEDQVREEWRLGVETRMQVSANNGAAELCTFEQWVVAGAGAPTHAHPVEEVPTVISGEAEMWVDEEHLTLFGGHSLIVPANRRHGFRNVGRDVLHVHAVLASSIFEARFDGIAEPVRWWVVSSTGSI
jgi:mannose-6-phosphate isomerase-like protein (cupin superfamily)